MLVVWLFILGLIRFGVCIVADIDQCKVVYNYNMWLIQNRIGSYQELQKDYADTWRGVLGFFDLRKWTREDFYEGKK